MKIKTDSMNQYSRRNNIKICNIPEKIAQRNLEQYVLKMLESALGINFVSYDLVAVHRVGKLLTGKNRNVIVRFMNRKYAYTYLRNSKKLVSLKVPEYKKLYLIENLCPSFKKIFNYLYKLKKDNKFDNVWTFNGSVFFKKLNSDNEYGPRVDHFEDINIFWTR